MKQEMMGWQWHQLDHMQIIFISLQTDNHASTSSVNVYKPDALPAAQPTAPKLLRENSDNDFDNNAIVDSILRPRGALPSPFSGR